MRLHPYRVDALLGTASVGKVVQPLDDAPGMYEIFQKKEDGCIKVVLKP